MSEAVPEPVSVSVVAGACSCVGVRACVGGGMYLCPRLCLCVSVSVAVAVPVAVRHEGYARICIPGRKEGRSGRKEGRKPLIAI